MGLSLQCRRRKEAEKRPVDDSSRDAVKIGAYPVVGEVKARCIPVSLVLFGERQNAAAAVPGAICRRRLVCHCASLFVFRRTRAADERKRSLRPPRRCCPARQ